MRKALLPLLLVTPLLAVAVAAPATAATGALGNGVKQGNSCESDDASKVDVNSATDTVAVTGDVATAGTYYGCYTNIQVKAGDTITFTHDTTCPGGGVPRVYVGFKDAAGENTHDAGTCTPTTSETPGTVSYTLTKAGKIRTFAFISDADNSTITYSDLTIAGNVINF